MTNTQHTPHRTGFTLLLVLYVIALCGAYHQGGVGMAGYVVFMMVSAVFIMGHATHGN